MAKIHTEQDFNGGAYDPPYYWYPFFATRADIIDSLFPQHRNELVVVAGSGYGYLIEELNSRQWNRVYGLDASAYAVNAAGRELPTSASRILRGDVLNDTEMRNFRRDVGRPRFIIDEDLLSCAGSVDEATTMLANLRGLKLPAGDMMHILTPRMDDTLQDEGFLWLSMTEWRTLIGPDDVIINTHGHEQVP